MGRHTAPVPIQPQQPADRVGRHTAPDPVQAAPVPVRAAVVPVQAAPVPVQATPVPGQAALVPPHAEPLGRHTAAVPTQAPAQPLLPPVTERPWIVGSAAASPAPPARAARVAPTTAAIAPRAAVPPQPAEGRPLLPVQPPRGVAPPLPVQPPRAVAPTRSAAPPQAPFAPRAARGTVAALPVTAPVPQIAAPSLSTAPTPVVARPERRRPVGRLVAVVAGLVVAGSVAAQIGPQRSFADAVPVATGGTGAAGAAFSALSTAAASPTSTTASPVPSTSGSGSASPVSSAGPTLSFGPIPTGPAPAPSADDDPSAPGSPGPDGSGSPSSRPSRSSASPTRTAGPTSTPSEQPGATPSGSAPDSPSASSAPSTSATPSDSPSATPDPTTAPPSGDAATVRSLRAAASDADGRDLDLGPGTWRFDDFRDDLLGVDLTGDLTGAGVGRTTISMTARSSTKRSSVPKKDWTTNQLSLVKISGAKEVGGFTLRGTEQGHLYNGLRLSKASGMKVHDVKVVSVPGNDDIPPGETFGINDFHTDGSRYSRVEVDGNGIASADFGTNSSSDTTITDSWFHDSGHANGVTFWQTRGVTVRDTRSTDNYDTGFNFERVSGDVLLDHVTMRGNRLAHIRINSDRGSADYRIVDPVFDGPKLKILMTPRYMGHDNLQKRSDVTVIIDGVDRTDDVVQWVTHF